jgi:GNAT superfamily N-acetyltransferase
MTGIYVRPARPSDASVALDVLRESITKLCVEDHRNDPETLQRWLSNKTPTQFARWLSDEDRHGVVAELESQICGVGMLHRNGDVDLCYVKPGTQKVGVGAAMMHALEEQATRWQLSKVTLISTVGARRFYERIGYTYLGEDLAAGGTLRDYYYVKIVAADV